MEKGLSKYWTPEAEEHYKRLLAGCESFAQRDLVMNVRDLLKYDLRTKAGKAAVAQGRLRIAVATDEDLEEMASLAIVAENDKGIEKGMAIEQLEPFQELKVKELKELQTRIRTRGIKRSELKCQKS